MITVISTYYLVSYLLTYWKLLHIRPIAISIASNLKISTTAM